MKKILVIALALVLALSATTALAAGQLEITKQNFHVINAYSLYGYNYVRVENTGDAPAQLSGGSMVIYDNEGNVLDEQSYINRFAEYLEPGQYTYAYNYNTLKDVEPEAVAECAFEIQQRDDFDGVTLRLPVTDVSYAEDVEEGYWSYDYMYATVTNDTAEPVYDIDVLMVLLDDEDNILYLTQSSMYSDKALAPGSSILLKEYIPDHFAEYFEANGITPTHVDVIAYSD